MDESLQGVSEDTSSVVLVHPSRHERRGCLELSMVEVLSNYNDSASRSSTGVIGLPASENEGIDDIGDAESSGAGGMAYSSVGVSKDSWSDVLSCELFCSDEVGFASG